MKFVGHAWVAVNSKPKGNRKLLIIGSILPEIMFYTKKHPFKLGKIHEGGDSVYNYLKKNKPEWSDLGIGMIAHSAKYGADKFNLNENLAILGYKGKDVEILRKKLIKILKVSHDTSKIRAHNILELAIELKIVKDNPEFIKEFNESISDKKIIEQTKKILTDCFDKSYKEVSVCVDELVNKAKPSYFNNAEGLASFWAELSREFDPKPNIKELAKLLTILSKDYSGKDEMLLNKCISWTRGNVKMFD